MLFLKISLSLLLFLGIASADDQPVVDFGFCTLEETGPDALTEFFQGKPVPRSCIEVDGVERCYYTYVPSSCQSSDLEVPLVFDIHGTNQCPLRSVAYTGWVQKAEEECFVLVMPISTGGADGAFVEACYNSPGFMTSATAGTPDGNDVITSPCCCADENGSVIVTDEPNDAKFISLVVEDVLENFTPNNPTTALSIDPARVYMGGHSNGCVLSLSVAQLYPESVSAVCCHAGALVTAPSLDFTPVPIMMIHGQQDLVIKYDGESQNFFNIGDVGIWSIPQTTDQLLFQNGCSGSVSSPLEGSTNGVVVEGTNCQAPVKVVTLPDAGHLPYQVPFLPNPEFYGGSVTTEDTTGVAWDFCKVHTRVLPTLAPASQATEAPVGSPSSTSSSSSRSSKSSKTSKKNRKSSK